MLETLFRNEHLHLRRSTPTGASRLIVSFANFKAEPGLDTVPFGQTFCEDAGFDALFVTCAGNDWYQYESMETVNRLILQAGAGYEEVITYGSSMGAYQAIKSAGPVGACRCVAIAPQFSIDPAKVPGESRWPQEAARLVFIDDEINSADGVEYVLVFDPACSLERAHIDRIKARISTCDFILPLSGHFPAAFLAEAGLISDAMRQLLIGEEPRSLRQAVRQGRRRSLSYLIAAARQRRMPAAWRQHWLTLAVQLAPDRADLLAMLSQVCFSQKRYAQAGRWALQALEFVPANPDVRILLARSLLQQGRFRQAQAQAREVEVLRPGDAEAARVMRKAQIGLADRD